ncbi:MAG TPA: DUF2662 domain-containing protein [Actinobacteria bacterium]|nr:DUF2662 domain-containing protein [Actinomycetota bacterium]
MNLLKNFEKKLESLVEGFFVKQFKSRIQPVEIAKKLAREMNEHKTIGVSKIYAPNSFTIFLSPEDKKAIESFEGVLVTELSDFVIAHAKKESLALVGKPHIKIVEKDALSFGEIKTEVLLVEEAELGKEIYLPKSPPVKEGSFLIVFDKNEEYEFPLTRKITTIGRLESNDISIKDPNISRVHAEIIAEEDGFFLRDLGSTNSTLLNGRQIVENELSDGDMITLGTTSIKFLRRDHA